MLAALVLTALLALAGAVVVHAGHAAVVPIHLALAIGAMPLITAAMLHFVPVLTRGRAPPRLLRALPLALLAAGLLAFASFVLPGNGALWRHGAATLGLLGAAALASWIARRMHGALGQPHPGVHWYLAAVGCLLLGLTAVLLMQLFPAHYLALRRFHIHINTLGFIGLTAIGTLQVLLPTVVGHADGGAAPRLRRDLKWALAGTLLIAIGAAWERALVWPGVLLWLWPLLRLAASWWTLFRGDCLRWNGAAPSLAGALLGFLLVLAFGVAHAMGLFPAGKMSVAYLPLFLLPLVTGAATHLLPLWLRPEAGAVWQGEARRALGRFAGVRVVLFLTAGVITAGWGLPIGMVPAALGILAFLVQLRALAHSPPVTSAPPSSHKGIG